MNERQQAVVFSLLSVAQTHHKKYSWPSQKKIAQLLEKYHNLAISNRTLNRDLRWLEDNGYISRLRRLRVAPDGKLIFTSTLYKFTGKLFNWLYSIGNKVKHFFSFFRLPKWADYELSQQQASVNSSPVAVQKLLIREKDGSVFAYDPHTGGLTKATD